MEIEVEKLQEIEEKGENKSLIIKGFSELNRKSNTKVDIFTNITDNKKIFNLESRVDNLINDFENSLIDVKEVLIKKYEKPLKEPVLDEETGEIVKDTEISMSCILIDKNDVSYATGSKVFTIQMMRYLEMFGFDENGFIIKIVKTKQKESGNKTLGFELV